MNEQKTNYKAVEDILERVCGNMLRISTPNLTLGVNGATVDSPLAMAADSGAERHVLAGKGFWHARNARPLDAPLIVETANGETV
eukprot:5684632-Pyramimonas_sp.AAC.1